MRKKVSIVGGGVAGLMLACELDENKYEVAIYERNTAPGRKFLVAGDGGLNLTHSEDAGKFISRYTPSDFLKKAFDHFNNSHLVSWFKDLGVTTFAGSSGRIFPDKEFKPIAVLDLILNKIKSKDIKIFTKHLWLGFSDDDKLLFQNELNQIVVESEIVIFCLGGASWPVTGSKGEWLQYFKSKNITAKDFEASNCAFKINWPQDFVEKIQGKTLKNISIRCDKILHKGEIMFTRFGIEGSGIYPLSPQIRTEIKTHCKATVFIDFKTGVSEESLRQKVIMSGEKVTYTELVRTSLNLQDVHVLLLKQFLSKEDFLNEISLIRHIKNFRLEISELGPVEDAISTVGGISLEEINESFELKKMSGFFVAGEMLDYDAPTGGYLLQSCFSMGKYLADYLNRS